ncbi:MAG: hypothetical protein R3338_00615 [Thermoanaerobaculia bacterium]|nr:hypothetical protein [Thermoanaerobaculia bacterium]
MTRNRIIALVALLAVVFVVSGCSSLQNRVARLFDDDPYAEEPFYYRYLHPEDSALDAEIVRTLEEVKADRSSAELHNRLGALLVEKGFPKDAEKEFRRAVWADEKFYPAWYNIALARLARGDRNGAVRALRQTLDVKPGHAAAHFQLALLLEKRGMTDDALHHYVEAYRINKALLDVRVNPLLLDSDLVGLALLRLYPHEHVLRALRFEPAPRGYERPVEEVDHDAPSEVAEPEEIVTPAPPPAERVDEADLPTDEDPEE